MMKRLVLVLIFFLLLLAACADDEAAATPTPFDAGQTAVSILAATEPEPLTLAELLEEPEQFQNQFLQLTGAYRHLPLLVCKNDPHPAPATWQLVESEEAVVDVGGFGPQLRSLIAEGTAVTVNGYWRYWEGAVGCGKQAVPRELWYFKVTELVSPGQIARGTAVVVAEGETPETPAEGDEGGETPPIAPPETPPAGEGTAVSEPITETATLPPESVATPTTAVITVTEVSETVATPTPERPDITGTPSPDITVTPSPGITGTPSPEATGSGSATPTPPAGTVTPGGPTPTPTTEAGEYTVVELGADGFLDPDDRGIYGLEEMGPWEKQNWTLSLSASELITIGVAAEPTMDIAIAVFDELDNLLVDQNEAPIGQLEEIRSLPVDPDLDYVVQVYDANGVAGNYFMTIAGDGTSVVLSSRGILTYGDTETDFLPEDHRHFWYFYGEMGDVIDISSSTGPQELILISLYNYDADLIEDPSGEPVQYIEEAVTDLPLPETGLYLIWLEEFARDPADYTISLTKQ